METLFALLKVYPVNIIQIDRGISVNERSDYSDRPQLDIVKVRVVVANPCSPL